MCLENVTYKRAKIATEDIPCYKILIKRSDGQYVTPYMSSPIILGRSYTSVLDNPDERGDVEQGLHAFLTLEQARSMHFHRVFMIVKCTIPKGARYYIGAFKHNYGQTAIAASAIKYNNKTLKKRNVYSN